MMKVQFTKTMIAADRAYKAGEVHDIPDTPATEYIKRGICVSATIEVVQQLPKELKGKTHG